MAVRKSTAQRKKEIVETALEIIFKQGMSSFTMRKLSQKIGISEAAIYKHFSSKKEIVNSLVTTFLGENKFYNKIKKYEDPCNTLLEIMKQQFEHLEKNPKITAIIFQNEIFREYPELNKEFVERQNKREELLTEFLTQEQKKGNVSPEADPQKLALIYMGSIQISIMRWKNHDFSYSLVQEAEAVMKTLVPIIK